ncbi:lipopolysaccharide export system protein LptA [Angulomicrobium tetraedrale]|uniref:Lipopolysaccharide export system protein LptA n=1 Tax=Ancylobacter tetraedralis TaxID=217068 RepID=A0A839ZEU7_9HYPH|nr:LptA/OstA family protein [Ancylobacter tetraedralis]MBB3773289.1 lipopolysaccharide export system protein LptA [Ancylobacter tetraedralis]
MIALPRLAAAAIFLSVCAPHAGFAQTRSVPNALQGFASNRDQPIRIDADSLEVLDQDKKAIFSGNVVVTQGDTTMRSKELVVFYDGKTAADGKAGEAKTGEAKTGDAKTGEAKAGEAKAGQAKTAAAGTEAPAGVGAGSPINSSAIRRLEINGSVVVTTKEQTATGDQGVFETAANTITLTGNPVVLTQGPNVIRGRKLTVDLTSGTSRFEGGRIESLIVPNSMKGDLPGAKPAAGAPAAAPKPATKPNP